MKNRKMITAMRHIIVALLFIPGIASAVGFGDLNVNSGLGEPLDMEIELLDVTPAQRETLAVGLASRADFDRAGVEYLAQAALLNFAVTQQADGQYVVSITTAIPVSDTFLHFLVAANWSGGKVIREYTALLDPPLYSNQPAAEIDAATTGESDDTDSTPSSGAAGATVTVQRGDTLSGIVDRLQQPESVTLYQVLTSLLQANPHAFINGNMNRLKAGVILNIPGVEVVSQIDRDVAFTTFQQQAEQFNQFLGSIGEPAFYDIGSLRQVSPEPAIPQPDTPSTATPEPVIDDDAVATSSAQSPDLSAAQPAVGNQSESQQPASLSIVQEKTEEEIAASDNAGEEIKREALKDLIEQMDESLLASGVESEEVQQRLQQIQEQSERVSRLIEVEDANLAGVQTRATETEITADEIALNTDTDTDDQSDSLAPSGDQSASDTDQNTDQAAQESTDNEANQSESESESQQAATGTIAKVFNWVADNIFKIIAGLVLLGAIAFTYNRQKSQQSFDRRMRNMERGRTSTNAKNASRYRDTPAMPKMNAPKNDNQQTLPGTDMSFLEEPEEPPKQRAKQAAAAAQAGATDPLAEADVYLSYNRDEQAVQVLKEAYLQNIHRHELAEKLLQIYYKQDERIAFDNLARQLTTRIDIKKYPGWEKIATMGREVSPNNKLYQQAGKVFGEQTATKKPMTKKATTKKTEAASKTSRGRSKAAQEKGIRNPLEDRKAPELQPLGEQVDEKDAGNQPETALELATAYLEIGEKEVAKGFIDEVMSTGNNQQKTHAENLMKKLKN